MNKDIDTELAQMTTRERERQKVMTRLVFLVGGFASLFVILAGVGSYQDERDRQRILTPEYQQKDRQQRERALVELSRLQAERAKLEIDAKNQNTMAVGRHVCDNQDGHYRGVVASIHQVNSDTVGPYTAYKLTNGQVAADTIVRVCTTDERERR